MSASNVIWLIENSVFDGEYERFKAATATLGGEVCAFDDTWWEAASMPLDPGSCVVFRGSLGNADRIKQANRWSPGAFCNTAAFYCSAWYAEGAEWLLAKRWLTTTASDFVRDRESIFREFGDPAELFVRPDSPLKPFSGRVVAKSNVSLAALDHGFYYDDASLPVVVSPVRRVAKEWRYVVVDRQVVAGSSYQADGRLALPDDPGGAPWQFAQSIASKLTPPDPAYVLDVCESQGALHLLELNPFSGADLYACSRVDVASSITKLLQHL